MKTRMVEERIGEYRVDVDPFDAPSDKKEP